MVLLPGTAMTLPTIFERGHRTELRLSPTLVGATSWRRDSAGSCSRGQPPALSDELRSLLDDVVSTHDIALSVINRCAVPMRTEPTLLGKAAYQKRHHKADGSDDHQNHTDGVNIEAMLRRTHGYGEIKDGSHGNQDDADTHARHVKFPF
jgi:hypothetical protein